MQLPILPPFLVNKRPDPKWDPFTPTFARLSKSACTHPIHTIVIIAILASTSYVSMLEHSLFDGGLGVFNYGATSGRRDLMTGKVDVAIGPETAWKWEENAVDKVVNGQNSVLVTLKFPDALEAGESPVIPDMDALVGINAISLPSDDKTTAAYAVPREELAGFVSAFKAVPAKNSAGVADGKRQWVMQIGDLRGAQARTGGVVSKMTDAFNNVWKLVQVRITVGDPDGGWHCI